MPRTATSRFSVSRLNAGLCAAFMALALSACGGGGSDSPLVASTAPVTTTAGTPPPTATAPSTAGTTPSTTASTPPACEKTHARVGQVATLSTRSHGVSGKATVIDNCTLEIRSFSYDGGGLSKVFVYGGVGGNYSAGFPIGPNLRGTVFANQTLTVPLAAGDLDKLDGISIWCIDANANFGDGKFGPA